MYVLTQFIDTHTHIYIYLYIELVINVVIYNVIINDRADDEFDVICFDNNRHWRKFYEAW